MYAVALIEERFTFFVAGLLVGSFSSKDLCSSIFDGGFKFIETLFFSSFPVGESEIEQMGLSSKHQQLLRDENNTRMTY